jgi:hypothetical protein
VEDRSKDRYWLEYLPEWRSRLEPLGCKVEISQCTYEIAKVKGDGVSLVIYAHRSSNTYNARIRDNGSKDKKAAAHAIAASKLWCKHLCSLTAIMNAQGKEGAEMSEELLPGMGTAEEAAAKEQP